MVKCLTTLKNLNTFKVPKHQKILISINVYCHFILPAVHIHFVCFNFDNSLLANFNIRRQQMCQLDYFNSNSGRCKST